MSTKKIYGCLLIFQLCASFFCSGQTSRIDSLANDFRRNAPSQRAGTRTYIGWDDDTKASFYALMSEATINDLIKYTNDSNAAVRAKIFIGLVQKGADWKALKDILDKHMNDTVSFTSRSGCLVMTWTVKEYMQFALKQKTEGHSSTVDFKARLEDIKNQPRIIIPGRRHDTITKDALLKADSLAWSMPGFSIISFSLTIGDSTFKTKNRLDIPIKRLINGLRPGERVYFDDIIVEGPDHRPRQIASVSLSIK